MDLDDSRLVNLAHQRAAARLAARSEVGEIGDQPLESVNRTTVALITDRFAATSPAFARLADFAQQLLTPVAGKPASSQVNAGIWALPVT